MSSQPSLSKSIKATPPLAVTGGISLPDEPPFSWMKVSFALWASLVSRASHVAPTGPFRVGRNACEGVERGFGSAAHRFANSELIRRLVPSRPPRDELGEPAPSLGVQARFHVSYGRLELGFLAPLLHGADTSPDDRKRDRA